MNVVSFVIIIKFSYIVCFLMMLLQVFGFMVIWVLKNGIKCVVMLVVDYGLGIDVEIVFKINLLGGGGQVLELIWVLLCNFEFVFYIQCIKDVKLEVVFIFVLVGEQGIVFMKGYCECGLVEVGIKVIVIGDLIDDYVLFVMGDLMLGVIIIFYYLVVYDLLENKVFFKSFVVVNLGVGCFNFMVVVVYDGMNVIYEVSKKLNGKIDGDCVMVIFKIMKFISLCGFIVIDLVMCDIVQMVYVCKVEKVGSEVYNVEFDKFENMKDIGK